jgi:uncharacterized membrane protein
MQHVTIATSSGLLWLILVTHFGGGLVALVAGTVALSVRKGSRLHKQSGMIFTWAMIVAGVFATAIAAYERKSSLVVSGLLVVYLMVTGTNTVRPLFGARRSVDIGLMLIGFIVALADYRYGLIAWQRPGHSIGGVPAGMIFFMATVCLVAALGDLRMIRDGGITGARRIARHLWRMCFGLFIATGSFFLGQMKFIPAPVRGLPLLFALAIAPLLLLLYWMWRVRLRNQLKGMLIAAPGAAPAR